MIVMNNTHRPIPLPNGKNLAPQDRTYISDADAMDRFVAAWIGAGVLCVVPNQVAKEPENEAQPTAKNWRDRFRSDEEE